MRAGFHLMDWSEKVADLPVQVPTKFELAVNLRPPRRWA